MAALWVLVVLTLGAVSNANITYKAAVAQVSPRGSFNSTASENNDKILAVFADLAASARKAGAQIVVFPEEVLWHWPDYSSTRAWGAYAQDVPPVGSLPCTTRGSTQLQRLSCIARNSKILLAANLIDVKSCDRKKDPFCPADNRYNYNTNVALNETGHLVAVYHKRHLGGAWPYLDEPRTQDITTFVSSFGVKFGMFICYDIDFRRPEVDLFQRGVRDIVFSTYWDNEPPLQVATMVQQGWSRLWGANLLASNGATNRYTSGSGIFSAGEALATQWDPNVENDTLLLASVTSPPPVAVEGLRTDTLPIPQAMTQSPETKRCNLTAFANTTGGTGGMGNCVFLPRGASGMISAFVAAEGVNCSLQVDIRSKWSLRADLQTSYILWASNKIIHYPGCPDTMPLQACALLPCAMMHSDREEDPVRCGWEWEGSLPVRSFSLNASFAGTASLGRMVLPLAAVGSGQPLTSKDALGFEKSEDGSIASLWSTDNFLQEHRPLYSTSLYAIRETNSVEGSLLV